MRLYGNWPLAAIPPHLTLWLQSVCDSAALPPLTLNSVYTLLS